MSLSRINMHFTCFINELDSDIGANISQAVLVLTDISKLFGTITGVIESVRRCI